MFKIQLFFKYINYSMINKDTFDRIYNFIYKFFFILKAAANGYIVKYIGNNNYEFYVPNNSKFSNVTENEFVDLMSPQQTIRKRSVYKLEE